MNFGFRPRVWDFEGPDELLEGLEFRVSGCVEGFIGFLWLSSCDSWFLAVKASKSTAKLAKSFHQDQLSARGLGLRLLS